MKTMGEKIFKICLMLIGGVIVFMFAINMKREELAEKNKQIEDLKMKWIQCCEDRQQRSTIEMFDINDYQIERPSVIFKYSMPVGLDTLKVRSIEKLGLGKNWKEETEIINQDFQK